MIGTGGENPGLSGMELTVKDSQVIGDFMSFEDLQRDNEGVLHKVVVDHGVENVDGAVVGSRGEQRVFGVEVHGSHGPAVVP
jgi:hypothetical protein